MSQSSIDCTTFREEEYDLKTELKLNNASFTAALKRLGITKDEALVIRDRYSKTGGNINFEHLVVRKDDLPSKFHKSIRTKEGKCYIYLRGKISQLPLDYLYVDTNSKKGVKLADAWKTFCLNHC